MCAHFPFVFVCDPPHGTPPPPLIGARGGVHSFLVQCFLTLRRVDEDEVRLRALSHDALGQGSSRLKALPSHNLREKISFT